MNIKLSYQPQQLPPPFAYAAVMEFESAENKLFLNLDLKYLEREELTDDELRAEGFTRNDDLIWKGEVNTRWLEDIKLLGEMKMSSEPNNENYLHIEKDDLILGFPSNIILANALFQELLQVVLEIAGIESPLKVVFVLEGITYEIIWKFSERVVIINEQLSSNWEIGRELMNEAFSLDFHSLESQERPTKNSLDMGEGLWYPIKDGQLINRLNILIGKIL